MSKRKKVSGKAKKASKVKKAGLDVPEKTRTKWKTAAAALNMSFKDMVIKAVDMYIAERDPGLAKVLADLFDRPVLISEQSHTEGEKAEKSDSKT